MPRVSRRARRGWLAAIGVALLIAALAVGLAQARPSGGGIISRVTLQGRQSHGAIRIYVDFAPIPAGFTAADGSLVLDLAPGLHTIIARQEGYLTARLDTVTSDSYLNVPPIELRGGDTNGDDKVNLSDLTRVGAGYHTSPPSPPGADINSDGVVDLYDLVILGSNYNRTGPLAWADAFATTRTPTPTMTPIPMTATPTPTITPTRTPPPFQPNGLCILAFADTNRNGVRDAGEAALAGRTVRIFDTQSSLDPANALASHTFTGTETVPRCFPNAGLESGTYRIQWDAAPAGGWGLIYSDPVAPVRYLVTPTNVWEVEVDAGKSVFFSDSGGTPQPTPTLTALNVCGTLSLYVPARPDQEGALAFFGQPAYALAPGTTIGNSGAMVVGRDGCLTATLSGAGFITSGTWAATTP